MSECVFCRIVAGDAPAHQLYEDDRTLSFLDTSPVNPGHALVVPTVHRETLTDVDADLVADLFRTVRRVAGAVESALDPDGLDIVQSNGTAAGQDVFHVHVHVIPRYEDDELSSYWPDTELDDESGHEMAAAVRDEL